MADDKQLTARGAATRNRILAAACDLVHTQGVADTSLDDVMAASGTGRSQLYHYFADKDALILEVVARQVEGLLAAQRALLDPVVSMRGLRRWRDAEVVDARAGRGVHGCPIGSLAAELVDHSEPARVLLAAGFAAWESYLAAALTRMRGNDQLAASTDAEALASGIMAALQGGLLLAQTTRDPGRLAIALDMALAHVAAHRTPERRRAR